MYGILVFALVSWLFYMWYTWRYKFWEKRGIPSLPATFPYGTNYDRAFNTKYAAFAFDDMYKQAAPLPLFGFYNMRTATLVLRDPELIRHVMTKDFSQFRDRQGFKIPKEAILGHHLFNLEGDRWRALRLKLTPTFTSGKLKGMFPHFVACAKTLDELLLTKAGEGPMDVKDIIACFTTDIICSCAFGLEVNTMADPDSIFRRISGDLLKTSGSMKYLFPLIRAFPIIFKLIKPRFTAKYVEDFLLKLIKDTVEHREKNGVQRNDFLDLLIQLKNQGALQGELNDEDAKKTAPIEMTIELMTAQCFVFFFAGFETSSSVQSFCLYELALHPEVQERLHKEIEDVVAKHGDVTYQAIQEMEYLDMVVSETMRKYPTLFMLTRHCCKDYTTPTGHVIKKDDSVVIPVWSLHHDPAFFPKPEVFDPERFSVENKSSIVPFSYLPFGEGPRICIGMRFGLLQTKMGLITVLRRYRLEPSEKTQIPLEFVPSFLLPKTNGPIYLNLLKR